MSRKSRSKGDKIRQGRLVDMGITYAMGTFNDNFFKQAAILLAATAQMEWLQGLATALFSLPFVLCSAWGGWTADKYPKRKVIIYSKYMEMAAMVLGAFVFFFAHILPTGLYWAGVVLVIFLMGLQSTFFSPALNGAIPETFPSARVPKINAILKLATTLTILLGIALAGVVLDLQAPPSLSGILPDMLLENDYGYGRLAVGVIGVCVALIGIITAHAISRTRKKVTSTAPFPFLGPLESLRQGLQLRKDDPPLYVAIMGEALFYGVSSFLVLCIANLGVSLNFSLTTTSLLSVALMVGICLGSLVAGRYEASIWRFTTVPAGLGMALGLILSSLVIILPTTWHLSWLLALFTFTGFSGGIYLIPIVSFIQIRPHASEKGRILGITNFASFSGILLSGLVFIALSFALPAEHLALTGAFVAGYMIWTTVRLRSLHDKKLSDTRRSLLGSFLRLLLGLRYRVRVIGLDDISAPTADKPILFLPNHPALIDPLIVYSQLAGIHPRPLSDENQMVHPLARMAARLTRAVLIPDPQKEGIRARQRVMEGLAVITNTLSEKGTQESVLLYPSGRIYRSRREMLGGNSGATAILRRLPNLRVVLVRTSGLWGSSFSFGATGKAPHFFKEMGKGLLALLANGIFFMPRREVLVEFVESENLPRDGNKKTLNAWLEDFYNEYEAPPMTVPRFFWQGSKPVLLPETNASVNQTLPPVFVSPVLRREIHDLLREVAELPGDHRIMDFMHLGTDLGLDSIKLMELAQRLEELQGHPVHNLERLVTVEDCLRAAVGAFKEQMQVSAPPQSWFGEDNDTDLHLSAHYSTVPQVFRQLCSTHPKAPMLADRGGLRCRRDVLASALVLASRIGHLPGERIGIMLPATPAATVVWLASQIAGKVPVFLNWTVGERNLIHCLRSTGVTHALTSGVLLERLERQGLQLDKLMVSWINLEQTVISLNLWEKIKGVFQARLPRRLKLDQVPATAAVLFTSGSEGKPKAVPLSHANLLTNASDISKALRLKNSDSLLAMLPPFHSFGLMVDIVLPLSLGIRAAFHPNPTESAILCTMVRNFHLTLLATPPTFLDAMLKQAENSTNLTSLRYVFVGAEKCPDHVYQTFARQCPQASLCEGYGITECSPVISVNRPGNIRPGSIGHLLFSVEAIVVREEEGKILERVDKNTTGMLLVRGPSIFDGYLDDTDSPFVEYAGKTWYRTGDLVSMDASARLTFQGRLKRFVKIGGEMISLPQIEHILLAAFNDRHLSPDAGELQEGGIPLAVEATPEEGGAEIVLFTSLKLDLQEVNSVLRGSGLSALYAVRRIIQLPAIPLLGSGKTDYRQLQEMLKNQPVQLAD